ncbi:hypothetical protein DPW01_04750 [Aggregatibacter aphrophilus]|nr:hypothetical protein DPW00_04325 [Aggregatibacter aphrophilus]RDE92323.1 hypothetical protein DPW01_04750 [Aggregatibacter aphrophilus]
MRTGIKPVPTKTLEKLLPIESSSVVRPEGAVGKANVQNPLDFVTALSVTLFGNPFFIMQSADR